jgi:predicted PhzF superfamily epimerase YddE/YHI9
VTTARLFHVDAFATAPFTGNPAAVLLLDRPPGDGLGPRIGAELNQPATAVTWPAGEPGRFGLRWFTAAAELDLCGHGTLAAARVLLAAGLDAQGELRFDTRAGRLDARAEGKAQPDWVGLRFPALPPRPPADPALIPAVTGLLGGGPVAEVLRSDLDAMAVLGSQAEVLGVRPGLPALARLPVRGLIVTAAADESADDGADGADFVSRFFAPATGIAEDAVTGSAHCTLAPYWIGRLGRQPLLGHQVSARGGQVRVTLDGDSVLLSGPALILSEGSWLLPG